MDKQEYFMYTKPVMKHVTELPWRMKPHMTILKMSTETFKKARPLSHVEMP